jgi:hypothetical protein
MAERVRVGVTGHRAFVDDAVDVAAAVDAVLDRYAPPGTVLEVRSSLAEGADRIVAERALLRPASTLVAVLPVARDDYADDFTDIGSFDDLLSRATAVELVHPQATREAAYEAAGRAVVDGSDVLVAVWDGEASRGQGGTAEIVAYARAKGIPVEVVQVRR